MPAAANLPSVVADAIASTIRVAEDTAAGLGGGGGGSGKIELTTEEVSKMGVDATALAPGAGQARSSVLDAAGNPAAFSTLPLGVAISEQYQAINTVFVESLNGLEAEITEFGENLIAAAKRYVDADDNSEAAFRGVVARLSQGTVASAEKSNIHARTNNEGLKLGDDDVNAENTAEDSGVDSTESLG